MSMPDPTDAVLAAEFPDVLDLLRDEADRLRVPVPQAERDAMWQRVLAKAALIPDGLSLEDTIRHVVAHSDVRPVFPPDFDPEALRHA